MLYTPAAVSDFSLSYVLRKLFSPDYRPLDEVLCEALGSRHVLTGTSWVLLLSLLLRTLEHHGSGKDVVLARYSCNEFTKAILLAGLRPVYTEVDEDLRTDLEATRRAVTEDTLAVIAVNNCGVESENRAIAGLCRDRGIVCIEDATYTYLGHSDDGAPFGSFGDFAILNFSEGKIIPVGGGAVAINSAGYDEVFEALDTRLSADPAASNLSEMLALVKYRAGASTLGYTGYRILKKTLDLDLKKQLSMEPTRREEDGVDLEKAVGDQIGMKRSRLEAMHSMQALRPLNRAKETCGRYVVENVERMRRARRLKYGYFRRAVRGAEHVRVMQLPQDGIPLRAPALILKDFTGRTAERLDRWGVSHHYPTTYPMYGASESPHANLFYERLYSVPLHAGVTRRQLSRIAEELRRL